MDNTLRDIILETLKTTAEAAGFGEPQGIAEIAGSIIGVFLSLLGIIFLGLIIYGGFIWMTSGGNEMKLLKAKKILERSIIGFLIIMASYSITAFVFSSMQNTI